MSRGLGDVYKRQTVHDLLTARIDRLPEGLKRTLQRKSVAVNAPPDRTRANTAHDARKDPSTAGTEIQCARCPMTRPKAMLSSAPARGKAGISQRVDTGVQSREPLPRVSTA